MGKNGFGWCQLKKAIDCAWPPLYVNGLLRRVSSFKEGGHTKYSDKDMFSGGVQAAEVSTSVGCKGCIGIRPSSDLQFDGNSSTHVKGSILRFGCERFQVIACFFLFLGWNYRRKKFRKKVRELLIVLVSIFRLIGWSLPTWPNRLTTWKHRKHSLIIFTRFQNGGCRR